MHSPIFIYWGFSFLAMFQGGFLLVLAYPYDFSVADTSLVCILCGRYSVSNKNDYCGFCGIKETEVVCQKDVSFYLC